MQEASTGHYPASLSRKAKLVTYGVGYGVGLGVPTILAIVFHIGLGQPQGWFLPAIFAPVLLFACAFRPVGYRLDNQVLAIVRPAGEKTFPIADIASVDYPAGSPPGAAFGLWRVEGFYGAWGLYWNRAWGRFRHYVTDDAHRIEVRLKTGMRIILSPDDPEAFVADLRARLGRTP